jgi:hypothetical protein
VTTYTAAEVIRRTGVTERMFDYWRREGYFGDEHLHLGSGRRDGGYTDLDLDVLRLMAALSAVGVKVSSVWSAPRRRDGAVVTIHASPAVTIAVDLSETTEGER